MLSSSKQIAINTLRRMFSRRGYELIPNWLMQSEPLVNHLRALFEMYSIDCVLDVGGNLGQYANLLRARVGFQGAILSFEPVSACIEALRRMAASDRRWEIIGCALGREAGEADINVTRSPGLNSFLLPCTSVVKGFWREGDVTSVERVQIRTLDEVLASRGLDLEKIRVYLKIDTQGFDLEVLAGATNSLPKISAVQTEASIRAIYDGMPSYTSTIEFLNDAGFDVSGMFPVSLDDALRLIEIDCIAINSRRCLKDDPVRSG